MPCLDGRPSYEPERNKRLDDATKVACELARVFKKLYDDGDYTLTKTTLAWIKRHEKEDAVRIKKEDEEKTRRLIKTNALAKLSKAERDILGLR
jgi:hypothetical protein